MEINRKTYLTQLSVFTSDYNQLPPIIIIFY